MRTIILKFIQIVFFYSPLNTLYAENIVCDLGEVLIHTDKIASFRQIGITTICNYCIEQRGIRGIANQLRTRIFTLLETIQERKNDCPLTYDEHNNLLPQCMCNWLAGNISSEKLIQKIQTYINTPNTFFKSEAEQRAMLAIIAMMLTPEAFIKTRTLNSAGLQFVRACKEAGHTLYVLSNWDPISIILLKQRFPELFGLFDGMVISGDHGCIKPQPQLYQLLIDKYNLDPASTIFLDDRPENLAAAEYLGITPLECSAEKTQTFDEIYDELNAWINKRKVMLTQEQIC